MSQPMTDSAIIDLYFDRNEQAIAETDRRYGKVCMKVSMNILESQLDAEECVNDTYLKTWNSIPPQRPNALCAFLCRITRNLSLNRLREMKAAKRDRDLTVALSELEACIPVEEERAGELSALLSEFLEKLDDTDRRLFMGRYWHAMPVKDLAEAWEMTPNAVSLRLHKTREKLRSYLEERGYTV